MQLGSESLTWGVLSTALAAACSPSCPPPVTRSPVMVRSQCWKRVGPCGTVPWPHGAPLPPAPSPSSLPARRSGPARTTPTSAHSPTPCPIPRIHLPTTPIAEFTLSLHWRVEGMGCSGRGVDPPSTLPMLRWHDIRVCHAPPGHCRQRLRLLASRGTLYLGGGGGMQHVYTLPYPNRDGSYGSNRGSTVADVQAPSHTGSRGYSTAVQGILLRLLKTLEHGLSGDPQRQVREGHRRTAMVPNWSSEVSLQLRHSACGCHGVQSRCLPVIAHGY
jgi:hypothetical protein